MRRILYLDMDGVLADLHTILTRWAQVPDEFWKPYRPETDALYEKWLQTTGPYVAFRTLPVLHRSMFLRVIAEVEKSADVQILSSTGGVREAWAREVSRGKRDWVREFYRGEIPNNKVNVVRDGAGKAAFAHPGAVLLDDSERLVLEFTEAGGHGVLHDAQDPLRSVQEVLSIFRGTR